MMIDDMAKSEQELIAQVRAASRRLQSPGCVACKLIR